MATTKQTPLLLVQHPSHQHPLELRDLRNETGTLDCRLCLRKISSAEAYTCQEGCDACYYSYHRVCVEAPLEILQYPSHSPDHTLVLFSDIGTQEQCQSCSSSLENEIHYRCTSCEFFVHVRCANQVVAFCEEGMSDKIKLSWHKHPLLLSHRTESSNYCNYCWDESIGPTYVCEEKYCRFKLHKRCTEMESTITHPHHPDHPLTLTEIDDDDGVLHFCKACGEISHGLKFSCERCSVNLHVQCAAHFPTHKHYLHEHKLLRHEGSPYFECNRCGRTTYSPLFRCVPCNFNLHEECMELPPVVKHDTHVHPLTLRDFYMEDDSGEYYCDLCGERRDGRLGVYVCEECKVTWAFHIQCVLPEIGKVYEKKFPPAVETLKKQIADKKEEVHTMKEEARTIKEKIEEATRELDELVKQLKHHTRMRNLGLTM